MSKMDDLRAMREARYEQMTARASKPVAAPPTKPAPVAPAPVEAAPVAYGTEATGESLCGHRAISGRTCTREQGHAVKSHRYS
jgi:hypothetical protein